MAKKTVISFSVVDFFGFRLAIPFENPLSLCAAVMHAILYPQRSKSDELGTLSLQSVLHAPGEFLNVIHEYPAGLEVETARQIGNNPWSFPLSLSRPPLARAGARAKEIKSVMTLFSLDEKPDETIQDMKSDLQPSPSKMDLQTPYLAQLRRIFSADNQKNLQIVFLRWLKETLVLYEQKIGTNLTYIYYPYHPYLLKQVKRFGPLGPFFAQQGAYDPEQFRRTRQSLLKLLIAQSGHTDYIEGIVRPLLLHEYAAQLATIDWPDKSPLVVVAPYGLNTLEFALYTLSAQVPCYLGTWEAGEDDATEDAKTLATRVMRSCFTLSEKDELAMAIFTPGKTPRTDTIHYFHCSMTGVRSIKTTVPLDSPILETEAHVQLGLEDAAPGLSIGKPVIHAPMFQTVMRDIERIATLKGIDRFDRLRWIDRLLNFHLVLYVLHRGVRDCNCCKSRTHRDDPPTCARFFAVVDCTREFRSDVAQLCYSDFATLLDGIRKNYSQFVRDRLQLGEDFSALPSRNAGQEQVLKYWEETLKLPTRGKAFKKFWSILNDTYLSADLDGTRTIQEIWTEALVVYFSSGDGDLARIFQVINTHGRIIEFVEPTTGSNRRRKLTMNPELLETLIHCIAIPGEVFISLADVLRRLYERYGLVINVGDAFWQREFKHGEDKKRIEGWISTIGEQNVDALRKMLREAGLLLEYSDSSAVVKVHYKEIQSIEIESEEGE